MDNSAVIRTMDRKCLRKVPDPYLVIGPAADSSSLFLTKVYGSTGMDHAVS